MHIAEGESETGLRIGGLPPAGVQPPEVNERTLYFGSFPISGRSELELSIFTSFHYLDYKHPDFFTYHTKKPLGADSRVLQCVFHEPAARASHSDIVSELQPYRVTHERERKGKAAAGSGVPHMIGGSPFYYPAVGMEESKALLRSGYLHFLQWNYPTGGWDCRVKGGWPFPNLRLNLYLKPVGESYEYQGLLV